MISTDGTSEAEFFCFGSVATWIVGKSCSTLFGSTNVSRGPPPNLPTIVSLKFTFVVTINMSAFSVTKRVFSILSMLTNHGRHTSIPCAIQIFSQQEMLTEDNILDLTTTHESPSTLFAKLSTCTNQENVVRYFLVLTTSLSYQLTYVYMNSWNVFHSHSKMLHDTNVSMLYQYIWIPHVPRVT
jgi:hypothetical protein